MKGWVGVDLDRTLAHYDKWRGPDHIGEPIIPMINLVKEMLYSGENVRIFTARVWPITEVIVYERELLASDTLYLKQAKLAANAIRQWCYTHLGTTLSITCVKDFDMIKLYDDRAIAVEPNVGNLKGFNL